MDKIWVKVNNLNNLISLAHNILTLNWIKSPHASFTICTSLTLYRCMATMSYEKTMVRQRSKTAQKPLFRLPQVSVVVLLIVIMLVASHFGDVFQLFSVQTPLQLHCQGAFYNMPRICSWQLQVNSYLFLNSKWLLQRVRKLVYLDNFMSNNLVIYTFDCTPHARRK